jgi:hypothetical protein
MTTVFIWISNPFTAFQSPSLSSDEAGLDYKYIHDRFTRGKAKVEAFMDAKHKLLHFPSVCMGHPMVVQMQGDMGADGFLEEVWEPSSLCKVLGNL